MNTHKYFPEAGSNSNSDAEDERSLLPMDFKGQQQFSKDNSTEISKEPISSSTPVMTEILSRPLGGGFLMDASFISSSQASNIGATSMMDQSSSRISEPGFIEPNVIAAYQRMEQKTSIERTSGNRGRLSNLPFAADLPI